MTYDGKPLSPAAMLDDAEYLRKVAADLAACEPLEALRRSPPAPAPRSTYVTQRELDRVLAKMGQMIGAELKPLRERIAELEAREWVGVFEQGRSYAKGAIVSHDGSAWVATRAYPEAKPGAGPNSGWRLIVKRGRDGRDAR
jgi:hypothetical protein